MIARLPKLSRPAFFTKTLVGLLTMGIFLVTPTVAKATTYTVSADQSLAASVKKLKPGDMLTLKAGTYREKLDVSSVINGTADKPITIAGESKSTVTIDGSKGTSYCVRLQGSYLTLQNVTVTNCEQHGILVQGKHIEVNNTVVTQAVQENNETPHTHWGSGLKVMYGAEDIILRNNTVFHNWGEGIAITRGRRVTVAHNDVYDNFSVNLYIDNSSQVKASDNFITCKPNTGFERDGHRPLGISLGEEQYDGWGAQLQNLTLTNNIVVYCHRGISYYSAEVSGAGLRTANIQHNILWGSQDYGFYLGSFPQTADSIFANNTIQQNDGKLAKVISTKGITFYTNTWINGTPAAELQSSTDQFSAPSWLKNPGYTRDSFKPPTN